MDGVFLFVILSVLLEPLSSTVRKSKLLGEGVVVSRVNVRLKVSERLPYKSLACKCRV